MVQVVNQPGHLDGGSVTLAKLGGWYGPAIRTPPAAKARAMRESVA
jgi:hypothetical protein